MGSLVLFLVLMPQGELSNEIAAYASSPVRTLEFADRFLALVGLRSLSGSSPFAAVMGLPNFEFSSLHGLPGFGCLGFEGQSKTLFRLILSCPTGVLESGHFLGI